MNCKHYTSPFINWHYSQVDGLTNMHTDNTTLKKKGSKKVLKLSSQENPQKFSKEPKMVPKTSKMVPKM